MCVYLLLLKKNCLPEVEHFCCQSSAEPCKKLIKKAMLERSPSHSWWWNSHNSPKHSKWLQSNLQELDEKVKEMLRLIEADADSFAQRAEMYYQKRPELVNLVEEFYRAYRSLAERYDDLTGEIRQNIPRALQLQYGLSCDSPKSTGPTGARLHFSPLRKNHQAFESLLKKAGQAEDIVVDSQQVDQMQTPSPLQTKQDTACDVYAAFLDQNGHNDVLIELEDREKVLSPVRDSTSLASDSDVDNANPLEKLQQEIQVLEKENKMLADSHKKVVELNIALQKSVEALEDRCKMQNKAHGPVSKADELQRSVSSLPEEKTVSMHNKSPLSSNIRDEEKTEQRKFVIKDMVARGCKDRVATDVDAVDTDGCPDVAANYSNGFDYERQGGADNVCAMQPPCLNGGLQNQVALLLQENQSQKLAILEREEEKREAIRQLCFSIDIWKLENQRLEVMLGLMKKRFDATVASHQLFSTWKRVLCLDG